MYQLINRSNSVEADIPVDEQQQLLNVLQELARYGWNQVQWGTGSILMQPGSLEAILGSTEPFSEMGKNIKAISNECFVEAFGDQYANYLRADAPTILEATRKCLEIAEKRHSCNHQALQRDKELVEHCPDCKMKRRLSVEAVLTEIKTNKPERFELKRTFSGNRIVSAVLEITDVGTLTDVHRIRDVIFVGEKHGVLFQTEEHSEVCRDRELHHRKFSFREQQLKGKILVSTNQE